MTPLQQLLKETDEKMKKSEAAVSRQFGELRGNRANPALVEHLTVAYYGTPTPLKQLAAITAPETRMLVVQPWDGSLVPAIEKAVLQSGLGISPICDGKLVRLPVPPLTEERRGELTKLVHKMGEEGHVAARTLRRDANDAVKRQKNEKRISEDEAFKAQAEIQKLTDRTIEHIDQLVKAKAQELRA